jgi:hypothetical protein
MRCQKCLPKVQISESQAATEYGSASERQVDTELVYAYAKTEDMGALEEFMSGTHQANLQSVGDRVFDEGMFEAARAIFAHIPNWGRLASTLVRLHQFQQAVDAARKANSPKTWKEVRSLIALPSPHVVPSAVSLTLFLPRAKVPLQTSCM